MTAYVIADDCFPQDLYLCVRDQCSRTVVSVKAKLHVMLRPYYIQLHPHTFNVLQKHMTHTSDPFKPKTINSAYTV